MVAQHIPFPPDTALECTQTSDLIGPAKDPACLQPVGYTGTSLFIDFFNHTRVYLLILAPALKHKKSIVLSLNHCFP